jgi:hypothetical protein
MPVGIAAGAGGKLEKVTERLAAEAPNMLRSGSELIGYYLSDDRHLPVG